MINDIYSTVNIAIPDDELVIVSEPQYVIKLVHLLNATSPRVIGSYALSLTLIRHALDCVCLQPITCTGGW